MFYIWNELKFITCKAIMVLHEDVCISMNVIAGNEKLDIFSYLSDLWKCSNTSGRIEYRK